MSDHELQGFNRNFTIVDNEVIKHYGPVIKHYGLSVYMALMMHANQKTRVAYPSNKRIARLVGCSPSTVPSTIATLTGKDGKLKAAGLPPLVRVKARRRPDGGHTSNLYTMLAPIKEDAPNAPYGGTEGGPPVVPSNRDVVEESSLYLQTEPPIPPDDTNKTQLNKTKENKTKKNKKAAPDGAERQPPNPAPDIPVPVSVVGDGATPESARTDTRDKDGAAFGLTWAYYRAMGVDRQKVPSGNAMRTKNTLKQLVGAYDQEDVRGCVSYMLTDTWWREPGRLTPGKVVDTLPSWVAQGRPEARVPKREDQNQRSADGKGRFQQMAEEMMSKRERESRQGGGRG